MYKISNWSSYQSYKDRKPPWIRLHRALVDNYEFQSMSANARALLPMLWLLACEDKDPTSGNIPYSINKIAFRLRLTEKEIKEGIEEIIKAEFLFINQPCNESVTEPSQDSNQAVTPETETETETEEKTTVVDEVSFDEIKKMYFSQYGNLTPNYVTVQKLKEIIENHSREEIEKAFIAASSVKSRSFNYVIKALTGSKDDFSIDHVDLGGDDE